MSETTNYVYKQLKQKIFSDGKAEDKVDIYPVIGFGNNAFTGSDSVLPIGHGGTNADNAEDARANLRISEDLDKLENKLVGGPSDTKSYDTIEGAKRYADDVKTSILGTINDSEEDDTVNGIRKYAKSCSDLVLRTIQGVEFNADDLQNLSSLSNALQDNPDIIRDILAEIDVLTTNTGTLDRDKVEKTDIYTDEGGVTIGENAEAKGQNSIAIGTEAKASENAVQLGQGINTKNGTLQFRGYQLVDAEGRIPSARLYEIVSTLPESTTENPVPEGTIMFLRQQTT